MRHESLEVLERAPLAVRALAPDVLLDDPRQGIGDNLKQVLLATLERPLEFVDDFRLSHVSPPAVAVSATCTACRSAQCSRAPTLATSFSGSRYFCNPVHGPQIRNTSLLKIRFVIVRL